MLIAILQQPNKRMTAKAVWKVESTANVVPVIIKFCALNSRLFSLHQCIQAFCLFFLSSMAKTKQKSQTHCVLWPLDFDFCHRYVFYISDSSCLSLFVPALPNLLVLLCGNPTGLWFLLSLNIGSMLTIEENAVGHVHYATSCSVYLILCLRFSPPHCS